MVADNVREYHAAEAKERQKRKPKSVVEKIPQREQGKARDKAGEAIGVNGKYVESTPNARQTRTTPNTKSTIATRYGASSRTEFECS